MSYTLEVFPESTQKYKENPRGKKCFNSFFPVFFLAEFFKGKRKSEKAYSVSSLFKLKGHAMPYFLPFHASHDQLNYLDFEIV